MAYEFTFKPVATIRAKLTSDDAVTVNVQGTNPTSSPANAKAQIDKILALTSGETVAVKGMTRTYTEEALDNG